MEFYQGEYSGLIEFSAAVAENPFGSVLLELAESNYEDIDTAVLDIAETLTELGYDASEEDVLGLMTGEIVPEEEVVEILSELSVVEEDASLTEKNITKLYQGAISAYDQAASLLEENSEIEEDEDEDEDVEAVYEDEQDEDEDTEVIVELDDETEQTFSRYFDEVDELRSRQVITDELSSLREYADSLLQERCLTPHAHKLLFSRSAKDDYVNFSQATEEAGIDAEDYLMCMNFALNLFEEMGPINGTAVQFSSMDDQDIAEGTLNFSANKGRITEEAREMLNLMKGSSVDRD